mmetsp:Transcript_31657/g.43434  ORF Transcript_31657/g.43434 Transcript_31657/m.43434 type:complete len:182 (-) Transcript_31657:685-1230(-)
MGEVVTVPGIVVVIVVGIVGVIVLVIEVATALATVVVNVTVVVVVSTGAMEAYEIKKGVDVADHCVVGNGTEMTGFGIGVVGGIEAEIGVVVVGTGFETGIETGEIDVEHIETRDTGSDVVVNLVETKVVVEAGVVASVGIEDFAVEVEESSDHSYYTHSSQAVIGLDLKAYMAFVEKRGE